MLHFLPLISFRNFKMAFMGGHYVVVAFRGRVFDGSGSFGGGDDKSSLNFLIMLDAVCVCVITLRPYFLFLLTRLILCRNIPHSHCA